MPQHKNIESMLDRGEKIDSLVEKSNDLNSQSKLFYKQVRPMAECAVNTSPSTLQHLD
jgi:synaptobrevin family protein YKT6